MARRIIEKDPDAVLDYKFDWRALTNQADGAVSDWLEAGETITTGFSIEATNGITVDSSSRSNSNTSITVWLSGGTVGQTYAVRCRIVTTNGRTDDRTLYIKVKEQ
jgi:hypothetical protein